MSETKEEKATKVLVEKVFKLAERIAREELESEYTVKCEVESFEVTSEGEVNARAVFYYVTKIMEISEIVASGLSDLREEMSESELEEEFERLLEEQMEDINSMYAINARGEIYAEVFNTGVLHIVFSPRLCDRDYCEVGLEVTVELLQSPLEILRANVECVADLIAKAVIYVVELSTL
jgi:hypothetical protein